MTDVFTQTEFEIPSEKNSPEHTLSTGDVFFSNPGNFSNQPTNYSFSLKFDANDEFFSVKNGTLNVNYALIDYLLPYTATLLSQDSSKVMKKVIHDLFQYYTTIPYSHWHSQQQKSLQKYQSRNISWTLPGKIKRFQKLTVLHIFLTEVLRL